ncbi:T6SS immunity protein Tli4 family protein [Luteimonas terrae]|uniref:Tle cognate immunity protein 4 C-terminal domain-containing protein n=1 Tax=Luteimonas terrae TaxID=1530191 RepID=A0ABU1XV39_9GAMM|nr:T6SS immunity protein Tli4 family protein [Luteimonas terrae]MDR7192630.1 hypothetical protein [Luteimonas terrae]
MKTSFILILFLFMTGLVLAGCSGNGGELEMADEHAVETRGVCLGRYTLKVPVGLRRQQNSLDSTGDATFYFGHDEDFNKIDVIVQDVESTEDFESSVSRREIQLKQKINFSNDGPMLLARVSTAPGVEVIQSYASPDSLDAVRMEVHTLVGGSHVVLGETSYSPDTRESIQSRLLSMLSSTRSLGEDADAAPGFCVGSVVFDFGNDYEEAGIAYSGRIGNVAVTLQVDINTFHQDADEPALIRRGEANLEGIGVRPEKLRAGGRALAGDAGEEWLGAFVNHGLRLHGFYAETATRKPTLESPKVLVSLSTGSEDDEVSATMDDASAIALWEEVLGSLKKRF